MKRDGHYFLRSFSLSDAFMTYQATTTTMTTNDYDYDDDYDYDGTIDCDILLL